MAQLKRLLSELSKILVVKKFKIALLKNVKLI